MGQIVFRLPKHRPFEKRAASTVHVIGLDGIPWPCKISREDGLLRIERNRDESGHVYVSYPFEKYGELVVSTGTLLESREPYHLTRELARGTLNRVRNQLSTWEEGGLLPDPQVKRLLEQATQALAQSVMTDSEDVVEQAAEQALALGMEANFRLCQRFSEQVLPLRKTQLNSSRYWMGVQTNASTLSRFSGSLERFELLSVSEINAETSQFPNLILGPLLDASAGGMPAEWCETDNFDERQSTILRACRERLHDSLKPVKLLHVVSGINGLGHRHLSYPQQLQITLELLQMIENQGLTVPTMVSFECPWAERLAWSVGGVHPLQIADSLLRRGVTLSVLGLEINLDYWPGGSLPRDPTQWIDLVDLWSQLGIPLVICLSAPSLVTGLVAASNQRVQNTVRDSLNDEQMFELLETVIPMILARSNVQGILWNQLVDCQDPRFPNGGLYTTAGVPKPIVSRLSKIVP